MTTQTTRTVTEAQVSWESDHEQYWQGHGISFSSFDECSTGVGSTLSEAFDDCLESLAQNDIHLTVKQKAELLMDLIASADEDMDKPVEHEDWHFYVSIDVKLSDSTELNSLEAL